LISDAGTYDDEEAPSLSIAEDRTATRSGAARLSCLAREALTAARLFPFGKLRDSRRPNTGASLSASK